MRWLVDDTDGAQSDLDEAWEIAERGPMSLFLADIHLYRARLFHDLKPYPWKSPQEDLAAARKLIRSASAKPSSCSARGLESSAARFSADRFEREMRNALDRVLAMHDSDSRPGTRDRAMAG